MTAQALDDARWMAAAVALADGARGLTTPNPNVGCLIVRDGAVIARGATAEGGRPHAEAIALAAAGDAAVGATVYVTLEPCAHVSDRGPACATLLRDAAPARVVIALADRDPRTAGRGIALLREAGIAVDVGIAAADARRAMAPWLMRLEHGRPFVTLKLAMSLDGCIARADGSSRWITGTRARAHGHLERARHDAILVGRGTLDADAPRLDVRIEGLEHRSPQRLVLTSRAAPDGWQALASPQAIAGLDGIESILVEGGAGAASAFLAADLVDRLLIYRAPILIGDGLRALGDIGLADLASAHRRWTPTDHRELGSDTLDVYERARNEDCTAS
jgi:diaminohydroxyphosphoribosylaminopyrimidine deaminase/5-amino-6-(5-phosphoribosylamino)uracil reductase